MHLKHDLRAVAARFQVSGEFTDAVPYGSGHINDTYIAVFDRNGNPARYVFQRINHSIFTNPAALMENIAQVTAHVRRKLEARAADQINRRVLTLVPARDGRTWHLDANGNYWRCYLFVGQATTYDRIETAARLLRPLIQKN